MKDPIEYYTDEELTNKIPSNELHQPIFDWGETIPGGRKERTFFMVNNTTEIIRLRQPSTSDEDFRIKYYPLRLAPKEKSILKLEFTPPANRIKPLNASFEFEKIIG